MVPTNTKDARKGIYEFSMEFGKNKDGKTQNISSMGFSSQFGQVSVASDQCYNCQQHDYQRYTKAASMTEFESYETDGTQTANTYTTL